MPTQHSIGIDVAQATLAAAITPNGDELTVHNTPADHQRLVRRLKALARVVLEATGGLERTLLRALATADLLVACIILWGACRERW